jgi:hypothetical protein
MQSHLSVLRDGSFRCDLSLRHEITSVVMSSFVDDASRLDWVIDHSDTLYLSRDESGALISLFLTARGLLEVGGRAVPALYTGLCATREDRKNSGRVVSLLNYCMYEARECQRREGLKLVIWGATASPSVYRIIQRVFANVQPRPDGDYSPASALIAQGIRRHLGLDLPDGAHPFVLPGFAAGVRYTDSEARRIAAVRTAKGFSMYEELRIREAAGDRLLFVADVPDVLWREPKSPAL